MLFLSGVMCFSLSRDMTELTLLVEGGQQTTTHPCWAQTPGAAERFSYEGGEPGTTVWTLIGHSSEWG